jgi:hypothetical protein
MLASIAMEESGCNPNQIGGAGEQGIMQITSDKCPNKTSGPAWYARVYFTFRNMSLTSLTPFITAVTQLVQIHGSCRTHLLTRIDITGNKHKTGASYFASRLSAAGGNVAEALGAYNGWTLGLSIYSPLVSNCDLS